MCLFKFRYVTHSTGRRDSDVSLMKRYHRLSSIKHRLSAEIVLDLYGHGFTKRFLVDLRRSSDRYYLRSHVDVAVKVAVGVCPITNRLVNDYRTLPYEMITNVTVFGRQLRSTRSFTSVTQS